MPESFPPPPWTRDHGFALLCDQMLAVFPSVAPAVSVDKDFGDYEETRDAFDRFGSNWSEEALLANRSSIVFANTAGFLFLLPRMISASLTPSGFNPDLWDYVMFGLEYRRGEFSTLFNAEQRDSLQGPLLYLRGGIDIEYGDDDRERSEFRRIILALRRD